MTDKTSEERPAARTAGREGAPERRPYLAPKLEVLGDIRDLTLGSTPGAGDSTPPNTQPF